MPVQSVDYIITAKHYSVREKADGTVKGRILKQIGNIRREHGVVVAVKNIDNPVGKPVKARIWQGQWIADCECGGAAFVHPDEPIYFCLSCMNRKQGGSCRPVTFPPKSERLEIERLLLERPVDDYRGMSDLERAAQALPILYQEFPDGTMAGLSRNWEPHETVAEIRKQNKLVDQWHKKIKEGS